VRVNALPDTRRLLVGSDFSPASAAALRLALAWAAGRQWELEVVHVIPPAFPKGLEDDLQAVLERSTELAAERNEGVRWSVTVSRGETHAALAERAEGGSWLVLGTEGSGSEALRRAGRTTSRACRDTPVPLLLAPPRWRAPETGRRAPVPRFERIVTGLSGGPRDEARLRASLRLARPFRPAVVHCADVSWARCYPAKLRSEAGRSAETDAEAFLRRFLEIEDELIDVGDEGSGLELHLLKQGPPHRDLAGLAESQSAELLVVGTGPTAGLLAGLVNQPLLVLP
jgi:nucleotide-binding universal stress UspA family protein